MFFFEIKKSITYLSPKTNGHQHILGIPATQDAIVTTMISTLWGIIQRIQHMMGCA